MEVGLFMHFFFFVSVIKSGEEAYEEAQPGCLQREWEECIVRG